ncbi:E3 ubiquitin-protein ligase MARCH11 isoform X2 [Neltuma alba]|uniref:E3 ubiquitin-protein ligase MARCH11 isoform X2 n=1 Tax=Neltuma alba TaxID=207710 RepID=UPI0010A537F5|nr:E3 ubiquitin-protein ligase MARCH11 isoform X2 [Prosopis alba]XP_028756015.1 E3 ubiquitin-protein ligase MARCH11 isoform X2 [Prosopis alba]XP_028756016.1 E3 ubiquitin-protein ligase MARCH11 isoform X2 [Prosopis alba]XP_028756017.1 E3 ubiquitin-protein ligase MARCH11 isoform X2 [Prosopis alba]
MPNESKIEGHATVAVDVPDVEKQDSRESNLCSLGGGEDLKSIAVSPTKGYLSRSGSSQEQCRICQQEKEESLIDLGCQCRGGLAKAHQTCIETWFRTRGSNTCEICQQVAQNVSPPESQPNQTDYWVWRIDPTMRTQDRERGCFSPLWVAFSILIGGLLLDVLISITFGVSALPVNIIIGVIIVLGLGTALRLALEFCHEWGLRRAGQRVESNVNHGYHPAV